MKKLITCSEGSQDFEEVLKDNISYLKEDFDYIVSGIDRLARQDMQSQINSIIRDMEEFFDDVILQIASVVDAE